jgi:transposase InsO family protein
MGLCRQGIYQQRQRDMKRAQRHNMVKAMIMDLRRQMPRLGTRKIYHLIQDQLRINNIKLGRDGLFDFLRSEQLLISPKKSYIKTTWSRHWMRKYPNLFKDMKLYRSEQAWVSDITYVSCKEGTVYLSLITDAFSRKIVGYEISNDLRTEGPPLALKMAIKGRKNVLPLLHHSDRGLQYCSAPYQRLLKDHGIQTSMTEADQDCYHNALAERVNGILKQEFFPSQGAMKEEMNKIVSQSIYIYNHKRPHLSLNYKTPSVTHRKSIN